MSQQDIYRACASVVVLRSVNDAVEVLLLHKPRKKDAWQLPQGGVEEGETTEEAALRELKEESGLDARVVGKSTRVYQYDFPESYRRFRPDNVCGQRIEYVFAVPEEGSEVQVDDDEINDFVWAKQGTIGKYIKRREYLQVVERLVSEGKKLIIDN